MRKGFLAFSCLALLLLGALVVGTGLGLAEDGLEQVRATPTPDGIRPMVNAKSPDKPALPDLVVENIRVRPAQPRINEIVMIEVTIKNQGLADVDLGPPPDNFYTDLYVDPGVTPIRLRQNGEVEWGCQAWWVPRDGSWTLRTHYVFTDVKPFELWAQVDTDDAVFEEFEDNNVPGLPVIVEVLSPQSFVQQTHQDFQLGMASNFDISHPEGVMRRGIFEQPYAEPDVYAPDVMINEVTETVSATAVYTQLWTSVEQVNPALTGDGAGTLFAAWEDGRYGGVYNRRILFSRSDDGGVTWGTNISITSEPPGLSVDQVSPDLDYDPRIGRLYAVWQDNEAGDYDIYGAHSDDGGDTWSNKVPISTIAGQNAVPGHQMQPTIKVEPEGILALGGLPGRVYVVWQDQRDGNDDVYLARSDDMGVTWSDNYFVTDDVDIKSADQKAPSIAIDALGNLFVVWEDWRYRGRPEVYLSLSIDQGETFGVDILVATVNTQAVPYQVEPTIAAGTYYSLEIPLDEDDELISDIHVAWQEGEGTQADIYWAVSNVDMNPYHTDEACPWPEDICFEEPQKVNGFVIDSAYARPDDPAPTWQNEPSWQGQVSIDLANEFDLTGCIPEATEPYSRGIYLVWSDASTYDGWRHEVHTRRIASPEGFEEYTLCQDHATGMVNDNAKLYPFRNDPNQEGLYEVFRPAATGQANPYLWVDQDSSPRMHVAWDDDRWNNPAVKGSLQNRDVFFARQGTSGESIYISQVFDAGLPAKWYVLTWWAATEHFDDLVFQTRFGSDPFPPQDAVTTTTWTNWTGNAGSTSLGCSPGAGCYYDAPGRHIVDPSGKAWVACTAPDCPDSYQYIQYKTILRSSNPPDIGHHRKTAISQVKIHYQGAYKNYLPLVIKGF